MVKKNINKTGKYHYQYYTAFHVHYLYRMLMQDTQPNKPVNMTKVKTIHARVNEPCAWRSVHIGKSVLDVTYCICFYFC